VLINNINDFLVIKIKLALLQSPEL